MNTYSESRHDSISTTLLLSAQAKDENAWKRIDEAFRPILFGWFTRRWKIAPEPSSDLVQNVLVRALTSLSRFHRDKPGQTFTGWLWVIAKNEAMDFFERQSKLPQALGGTDMQQAMAQIPDIPPDDDEEEQRLKLNRLIELVRREFSDSTNVIFQRVVLNLENAADVAADLGMKNSAVREAKRRVLQRLRKEWTELFGQWPYASHSEESE